MKTFTGMIVCTAMAMLPATLLTAQSSESAPTSAANASPFRSDQEKISYAIGLDTGRRMRQSDLEVDFEYFLRGLRDGATNGAALLSEAELRETFTKLRQDIMNRQEQKRREQAEKNLKESEAFFAANKDKPGIVTLPSGLQYTILADGDGPSPGPEDLVTVHYRGTLLDGTEFDRSPTNKPVEFAVNAVIRGWSEALTRMKAGSKWKLFIPPQLAYGERGAPPKIGPNAALIFDVELVSFRTPPPPTNPPPAPPITSDIIKVPSLEEMKKGAKIEVIKAEDVEKLQKQQQQEQAAKKDEAKTEEKKP
ncbi:MAG: FKBP-type peptidyl-prolyl cis-trans isomerase [Verrucomicrobiae bacterium]|nr:FKBP-type peptidyl-prolyl cis-trans isomerase [Verrucomicrobiae bacterium]